MIIHVRVGSNNQVYGFLDKVVLWLTNKTSCVCKDYQPGIIRITLTFKQIGKAKDLETQSIKLAFSELLNFQSAEK